MLTTQLRPPYYLDADLGVSGEPAGGDPPPVEPAAMPQPGPEKPPATWEAYLASLSDEQKSLVENLHSANIKGLKSALDAERATNKEHAAKLKKLSELEAEEQKRQEAAMTEQQKLQAELERHKQAALEAQAEKERIAAEAASLALKTAVLLKAAEMGFEHPEDAYALADIASIEADERGNFTNLDAVLEPIKTRLPVKTTKTTIPKIGPTNPGASGSQEETEAQARARIFGSSTDIFNPAVMRAKGGGAFIVDKQIDKE